VEHHFEAPVSRSPFPLWQEMSRSFQRPETVHIGSKESIRGDLLIEKGVVLFHREPILTRAGEAAPSDLLSVTY